MIQVLRLLPGGRRSEHVVALRLAFLMRPPNQYVEMGLTRRQESTLWLPVGGEAYTSRLAARLCADFFFRVNTSYRRDWSTPRVILSYHMLSDVTGPH